MPIVERDPWRQQYFAHVACPDDVIIPTDDETSYVLYPAFNWVFNKLQVCQSQGLECAPHGVIPRSFPVFSKPIYNLYGMGSGIRIIDSVEDYERWLTPGHMWMPLLEGEHVSSDATVVDGKPKWWRHTVGKALDQGTFDYWTVLAEARPEIEEYCAEWLERNLRGYTGTVNLETIGNRIIEVHLRFADQWPDLYGSGWIESLVDLYAHGSWNYADEHRQTGYSVVLFGGHGLRYSKISQAQLNALRRESAVSSIQITFHEDKPPELHAMPPGGFRLAIVNCWELEKGLEVRKKLALLFWTTHDLHQGAS